MLSAPFSKDVYFNKTRPLPSIISVDRVVLLNRPTFLSNTVTFNNTLKMHVVTPYEKNLTAWNAYWLMKGFVGELSIIQGVQEGERLFHVMNMSTNAAAFEVETAINATDVGLRFWPPMPVAEAQKLHSAKVRRVEQDYYDYSGYKEDDYYAYGDYYGAGGWGPRHHHWRYGGTTWDDSTPPTPPVDCPRILAFEPLTWPREATWSGSAAVAASYGGRLPKQDEWVELRHITDGIHGDPSYAVTK